MQRMRYWQVWFTQHLIGSLFKILNLLSHLTGGLIFMRVEMYGLEHLRNLPRKPIFTPNHKTYIDHFLMGSELIGKASDLLPVGFAGADWVFNMKIWLLGPMVRCGLWLMGAHPLNRGKGIEVSLAPAEKFLANGFSYCIYPEGGIRPAPGIHETKRGAGWLAARTGAPIVPVAISGLEYFRLKSFFLERRMITVRFGPHFFVAPDADMRQTAENIRERIAELYEAPQL